MCATLAGQLNHLAESAVGWPGAPDYPDYNDWTDALRTAAAGLNGWATHEDSPGVKTTLAAVERTVEEDRAAAEAEAREDDLLLARAQDGLRWVADNLSDLWD